MKKFRKIIIGFMSLSFICSSLTILSPMTVYAQSTVENGYVYMESVKESDYVDNPSTRSIFTKIAKTAVKTAINNKARLIDFVETVAGKTVAKNVDKFFTPITKALTPLLE